MLNYEINTKDFDQWSDLVNLHLLKLRCETAYPNRFFCSGRVRDMDDTVVAQLSHSALRVQRLGNEADNETQRYFKIYWQVAGESRIRYGTKQSVLKPGTWSIYDANQKYEMETSEQSQIVLLLAPQSEHMGWTPAISALRGEALRGGGATYMLISSLSSLLRDTLVLDEESKLELRDVTAILVEKALESRLRSRVALRKSPADRMEKARRYVQENIADPELTAESVAKALSISRRNLYNLFLEFNETPRAFIQSQRLEHARSLLSDTRWKDHPVGSIALLSGFSEPSHFSRAFSRKFGLPPAAWRGTR